MLTFSADRWEAHIVMTLRRRFLLAGAVAACTPIAGFARAQGEPYSFAGVRQQAKSRPAETYKPPAPPPSSDLLRINSGQFRPIRFRSEAVVWRGAPGMFRAEFFPARFISTTPITTHTVAED